MDSFEHDRLFLFYNILKEKELIRDFDISDEEIRIYTNSNFNYVKLNLLHKDNLEEF